MKIVIVTPYYAPAWAYGGPPKVLSILSEDLTKHGHTVIVITTDALDEKRNTVSYEEYHGVQVHRFTLFSNTLAYKAKIFYVPNLCSQSKKIIDECDIVLFSDVRSILNWQLFEYVSQKKIRYGIFAFGQIPYGQGWKTYIKKLFDVLWVRRFVRFATWCFSQTTHEQHMYHEFFQKAIKETQLLPLPIDISNQPVQKKHDIDVKDSGISPKDTIILFVGRFHYLKGVDILIQACIPLLRAHHTWKLVLIGRDDGALDTLRHMVPRDLCASILFPGPLYGEAMSTWYSRAGCFVFTPRYYEETSTAALEALSYGCPVVTVPQSEIPFLSVYNAGISVRHNVSAIRKGILGVLKQRKTMSVHALHLIKEHYDSQKIMLLLLSFFR